ncbi:MAG: YqjF family protein [Sphingobacteriaceae bacterium]
MKKTFLKAEWRKLAMANYSINADLLKPYLPCFTEIDLCNDRCYISLVGFMFLNTRLKGVRIPFHSNFEEVNLRFYVRYKENGIWKRGVVFIKEIVPKPALTFVANAIYKENYETMKMSHSWQREEDLLIVEYRWKKSGWNSFKVSAASQEVAIASGSEEEFITEHFWGYTSLSSDCTSEYEVTHPTWNIYPVKEYSIDVDFGDVYGEQFSFLNKQTPDSVFLAEGSEICVKEGSRLTV